MTPQELHTYRPTIDNCYKMIQSVCKGIGKERAMCLLAFMGSPKALVCTNAKLLMRIPTIGEQLAKRIEAECDRIRTEYNELYPDWKLRKNNSKNF